MKINLGGDPPKFMFYQNFTCINHCSVRLSLPTIALLTKAYSSYNLGTKSC